MELDLTQRQGQVLSPQMIQSAAVLQMASQELTAYLETILQENPVLELDEHHDSLDEEDDLAQKLEWLEANDPQNREYYRQDAQSDTDPLSNYGVMERGGESLYQHLSMQLYEMDLDDETVACARLLASSLNQDGWLDEDIAEIAWETGQSISTMEKALKIVQSLEPAGVGARSLSECLRLQLLRQGGDKLAISIVEEYLDALSKNRYGFIGRSLGVGQNEVLVACQLIRSLNPRPGSDFTLHQNPAYITPDIIVITGPGHFELTYNDWLFPTLNISPYYSKLLKESGDEQVKDYLTNKLRQAKWTIRAVDQRKTTLTACVQCILEIQEDFFRLGEGHLKPMSLSDIAQRVGLHESTVSRAVSGKYIQCAQGTFPLNDFFSRSLGPGDKEHSASPDKAKALLKKLIGDEDQRKPLSDQKLCEHMAAMGCILSRRTVAKYRDELGIPGISGRKLRN